MKKIIAILLACLMLLTFAACNSDKNENDGKESSSTPPQSGTPAESGSEGSESGSDTESETLPTVIEMTAAEKKAIEDAWLAKSGEALEWYDGEEAENAYDKTRYYGIFGDGYYVFFKNIGWEEDAECIFKVGDYSFAHDDLFEIYCYKEGVFYELHELYESEKLFFAEVMIISYVHEGFESYLKK